MNEKELSNDEIRIAIAELMLPLRTSGIVEYQRFDSFDMGFFQRVRFKNITNPCYTGIPIPNYPEDLNAMHGVISTLKDHEEMWNYLRVLKELVAPHFDWEEFKCPWCLMNATARQRAEAFLKVKGLWK